MNKDWENFGYDAQNGCDICGEKPAKIEPRFLYRSCEKHSTLSPVEFSKVVPKGRMFI